LIYKLCNKIRYSIHSQLSHCLSEAKNKVNGKIKILNFVNINIFWELELQRGVHNEGIPNSNIFSDISYHTIINIHQQYNRYSQPKGRSRIHYMNTWPRRSWALCYYTVIRSFLEQKHNRYWHTIFSSVYQSRRVLYQFVLLQQNQENT
jgi:hypothetical protein